MKEDFLPLPIAAILEESKWGEGKDPLAIGVAITIGVVAIVIELGLTVILVLICVGLKGLVFFFIPGILAIVACNTGLACVGKGVFKYVVEVLLLGVYPDGEDNGELFGRWEFNETCGGITAAIWWLLLAVLLLLLVFAEWSLWETVSANTGVGALLIISDVDRRIGLACNAAECKAVENTGVAVAIGEHWGLRRGNTECTGKIEPGLEYGIWLLVLLWLLLRLVVGWAVFIGAELLMLCKIAEEGEIDEVEGLEIEWDVLLAVGVLALDWFNILGLNM